MPGQPPPWCSSRRRAATCVLHGWSRWGAGCQLADSHISVCAGLCALGCVRWARAHCASRLATSLHVCQCGAAWVALWVASCRLCSILVMWQHLAPCTSVGGDVLVVMVRSRAAERQVPVLCRCGWLRHPPVRCVRRHQGCAAAAAGLAAGRAGGLCSGRAHRVAGHDTDRAAAGERHGGQQAGGGARAPGPCMRHVYLSSCWSSHGSALQCCVPQCSGTQYSAQYSVQYSVQCSSVQCSVQSLCKSPA